MSRSTLMLAAALTFATAISSSRAPAAELRTWTDSTGKFKIRASFLDTEGGNVRLRRVDGKSVSLPLAKLSAEDRAYVDGRRDAADANPFEEGLQGGAKSSEAPRASAPARPRNRPRRHGSNDVFQPGDRVEVSRGMDWVLGEVVEYSAGDPFIKVRVDGEEQSSSYPADEFFVRWAAADAPRAVQRPASGIRNRDDADPTEPRQGSPTGGATKAADVSGMKRIANLGGAGRLRPDPAPPGAPPRARSLSLPPANGFFVRVVAFDLTPPSASFAAIGYTGGSDPSDRTSSILVLNTSTGKTAASADLPNEIKLLAISPTGKRLATICDAGNFQLGPVEIWDVAEGKLRPTASWRLPGDAQMSDVKWLGWLDDDRLLTLDGDGLSCWQANSAKGVYRTSCDNAAFAAFSAGRWQIAVVDSAGVIVHNAASGEVLAHLPLEEFYAAHLAFSPNGQSLAVAGTDKVVILDLASRQTIDTVYCQSASRQANDLCWLTDEHVLVAGRELIHVPSRMVVWTYEHDAEATGHTGVRPWYLFRNRGGDGGEQGLLSFALPQAAARPVAEKDLALPPGSMVMIETESVVDMRANPGEAPVDLNATAREMLEGAGFRVVDEAPVRLVASIIRGQTKETTYQTWGFINREQSKVSVTQNIYELKLYVDGDLVWSRRNIQDSPPNIHMEKGETIKQAVERVMASNAKFFGSGLPSRILPTAAADERTSRLGIDGMR